MTRVVGVVLGGSRITLSWKAYFFQFVERHGDPVLYEPDGGSDQEGFLIFPDGWRYAIDYRGPEFEPPNDLRMLKDLQETYWRLRRGKLQRELDGIQQQIKWVERRQELTDIPLQQIVYYRSQPGDGGPYVMKSQTQDLNLVDIKYRAEDLSILIQECETKQEELSDGYPI